MNRTAPHLLALALALGGPACSHSRSDTATAKEPAPVEGQAPAAETDDPCSKLNCEPPEECIRFVGIGGPRIPLAVCGIPCEPQGEVSGCPDGMTCVRMADGPTRCERERAQGHHSLPDDAPAPPSPSSTRPIPASP